jgi:outer membrane cobalamin receptor
MIAMSTERKFGFRGWVGIIAVPCLLMVSVSATAQQKPATPPPCTPKQIAANDPTCTQDEGLQEVVVTGSRIARPDLDRLEPTTTIDAKTFDQRGYLDVGQALSELPAFGVQPSSAANTQNGFGIAQSFVDLYSLGSQRTLVLVDGRRFVSESTASLSNNGSNSLDGGPGQQVDLNVIPTKLIDHVETIAVGGAPIYGADAISGTVNIILKHDYQGIDVDGQVGASDVPDAWTYRARILAGTNFADGRGNITTVAEFTKTDGLTGTDRSDYSQDLQFEAPLTPGKYTNVLIAGGAVASVNYGGIPLVTDAFFAPAYGYNPASVGVTNAAGQVLAWAKSSTLTPYNLGTQTGNPIFWQGGDGLRLSQTSNLLSPTERINVDTLGNFDVTDHWKTFWEGWFSETHATNLLSQPAYNSALFGSGGTANGNFLVSINNPFLSPTDRTLIQNALNAYGATAAGQADSTYSPNSFYVARGNIDLQSGEATGTQTMARGVIGSKGDFDIVDHKFNWDAALTYGESSNTQVTPSYVFQNVLNALNSTLNAQGQIVCAGTPTTVPVPTVSSTCAPLNIFGEGSPSLAARQYITALATATSYDTQRDFTANLSGDVLKLPAGEWKASIGFENRRESGDFSPDLFYTGDYGQSTQTAVEGSYRTNELYGETLVPIFSPAQDILGLHRVEFEGAVRRVDNSIAGNATTWTVGARWAPTQDIQFRGNKTESIRAPSITELFLPSATSFQFANDPCDHDYVGQGSDPAVRAKNCAAAGINTSNFVSNVVNATAIGTSSGNTSLTSETAYSKTYGFVLTPRWVPKLNITFDYVDIKLTNAIETLTLQDILDACYDSTDYPNNPQCKSFTRNSAGQITDFHAGYVNAGLLEFTGYTAALDYTFELPRALGTLETRANWLDTARLEQIVGTASPVSLAGNIGTSKSKGTINLNYDYQGFSWDWQGVFIGPALFNNQNSETQQNILGVGAWWVINTTVGYQFTPAFKMQIIVDNLFDKQPPYPALAGTGGNFVLATSQYFSGVLGRSLLLSADYKFR